MKYNKFTYQKSGVNISEADKFVNFISKNTGGKKHKNKNIGGFGSISNIPKNFKNPKIVASTDGVGTKIEIANQLNKFNTIGIDINITFLHSHSKLHKSQLSNDGAIINFLLSVL